MGGRVDVAGAIPALAGRGGRLRLEQRYGAMVFAKRLKKLLGFQ